MRNAAQRLLIGATLVALGAGGIEVFAATNAVPETSVADTASAVSLADLGPLDCAGVDVTAVVTGSILVIGSAANELLLGSPLVDDISGAGGDDCIVGGGGADILSGGPGADVLIGGPGLDICTPGGDPADVAICEIVLP